MWNNLVTKIRWKISEQIGEKNCVEKNWVEKVYSVMCTLNSAPQFVEEALVFLSLGSYLGSHLQRRWFQLSDKVGLIIQQW